MCELFGICAATPIEANDLLKKFYAHSVHHPHGWGLALLDGGGPAIEKEPVCAAGSTYLKYRLKSRIASKTAIAHIRYATQGVMEYDNTHPSQGVTSADARGHSPTTEPSSTALFSARTYAHSAEAPTASGFFSISSTGRTS